MSRLGVAGASPVHVSHRCPPLNLPLLLCREHAALAYCLGTPAHAWNSRTNLPRCIFPSYGKNGLLHTHGEFLPQQPNSLQPRLRDINRRSFTSLHEDTTSMRPAAQIQFMVAGILPRGTSLGKPARGPGWRSSITISDPRLTIGGQNCTSVKNRRLAGDHLLRIPPGGTQNLDKKRTNLSPFCAMCHALQ